MIIIQLRKTIGKSVNSPRFVLLSAYWFSVFIVFAGLAASIFELHRRLNLGDDFVASGIFSVLWLAAMTAWFLCGMLKRFVRVWTLALFGGLILVAACLAIMARPEGILPILMWSVFGYLAALIPIFRKSDAL